MKLVGAIAVMLLFAACEVSALLTDPSHRGKTTTSSPPTRTPPEEETTHGRSSGKRARPEVVCQQLGPPRSGRVRIELWFQDFTFGIRGVQAWRAVMVHRDVRATDSIAAAAVQAWIDGPTPAERKLGAHRTAPEGVELRGIDVEAATAQVDMTEEIHYTQRGTCCEVVVLDTLIGTVTQFDGIERVQLWTDGERAHSFGGHGELLEPEGRERDLGPRYVRRVPVC